MSIGLLGQKIGMTSVYDATGRLHPVTVIAAGDNVLLRRLTAENDGYSAVQVGFDTQKESRVTKQLLGEFKKAGVEPKKFVRELRLEIDTPEGEINLSVTQFQAGDYVDVTGRSKGKGFQGVMKKHNFHGQGAAHGSSFRNSEHENQSGRRFVWCETVAAKRNRPRPRRLQIVADLAGWRRRVRTKAARLFQKGFEKRAASRFSKSAERADQRGRCADHRPVRRAGTQNEIVRGIAEEANGGGEGFANFGRV